MYTDYSLTFALGHQYHLLHSQLGVCLVYICLFSWRVLVRLCPGAPAPPKVSFNRIVVALWGCWHPLVGGIRLAIC